PGPPGLVRSALRAGGGQPPRPALPHPADRDRADHPPAEILDAAAGDLLANLVAALQLGIETRFGGSIGNLEVDVIAHPTQAGHQAVLLSDNIVGGTGYL